MASSTRLATILLIFSFAMVVCANRCAGPAGTTGNFNASVRLSFTNAKHVSPTVSWWNQTALYPFTPDPQYCDNNKPSLYPSSPWVCPTDNFGVTTNKSCPGGCDTSGRCLNCGTSDRGSCHGEYFDCGYQSQLRWGTPTSPRDESLATDAKSGFAFSANEGKEIVCSKNVHIGDLAHLNWAVAEAAGADAVLSMELNIQGFAEQPLTWSWRMVHYEAPDNIEEACPGVEDGECCSEAVGYCKFGGDVCSTGCNDVVGFYEFPYKEFSYETTEQFGHGDTCVYNVTVWLQVQQRGLICLPINTDNSTNPLVVAWQQTEEQKVTRIPLFVRIDQHCGATETQTQTTPAVVTTRPVATTPAPVVTTKSSNPCETVCGECGTCDLTTGLCMSTPGKLCGDGNGCMICSAEGQCVMNSNRTCSLGLGEHACTSGICAPTGKCIPDPEAPVQVGLPCGTNTNMCELSYCDAMGRCVAQRSPEGTTCEVGDPNECVVAMCNAEGQCEETLLENFPCKGQFLLDEKDNSTWCKQPICIGRECVMQTLPPGTNCTPANATICEVWQCNIRGECERNDTLTLCVPPPRSRRWVVAAGVAGGAFAIIALAALAFLAASRAAPVPAGAQVDTAVPHMNNSPLYNPMLSVEGASPLYTAP